MDGSRDYSIRELIFDQGQDPDHHAIECPGHQPLTYRGLRLQITQVVRALNSRGFHHNDRIAVIMPAGPETAVAVISVMAGFTSVPLNPHARSREFDRYFSQMKIRAVIVRKGDDTAAAGAAQSQGIPVIELVPFQGKAGIFTLEPDITTGTEEAEFAAPADIAILLLTSGTTGLQKIAPITQRQFLLAKQKQAEAFGITRNDRSLHILPYYHAMGLSTPLLCTWLAGGTVICTEDFIPADFLPLLKTYRPTFYAAGPALHQAILREIKNVSRKELENNSLQKIQTATAPLSSAINRELGRLLGVQVIETYGMAEAGIITMNNPPRTGSVGIPVIESLTIRDENGTVLGNGESGEIVVKDDTVFNGYEDAPAENREAFLDDGAFRTGDIGYIDKDGYLFITGRIKEAINKGGEKILPEEIDAVIKSHPGVRDAMTFAIADPLLGEDIAAMVVPAGKKVTEPELRRYLLDRLVQFKVPRKICFVDRIPKTPNGKPMRLEGTRWYSEKQQPC